MYIPIIKSANLDSTIDRLNITFSTLGYTVYLVGSNSPIYLSGFEQFCKKKSINYKINTSLTTVKSTESVNTIKQYLKSDFTNKKRHLSLLNRITNLFLYAVGQMPNRINFQIKTQDEIGFFASRI